MAQRESTGHRQRDFSLDGMMAVVTGASKGIGRGTAIRLAQAGADVGLIARSRSALEEVAAEIDQLGRRAYIRVCDVADLEGLARAIAEFPVPDVFVNNAGRNIPEHFLDVSTEHFDEVFAINVRGAFFAAQFVARRMLGEANGGVIVNVSSQAGHVGLVKRTVYCASKHALEGLTKTMAMELAPKIRVVSVAPTFIETPMTKPFLADGDFSEYVQSNLLVDDVGTVEDVANAVLFAASRAGKLMTGSSIILDGGWTAH